MISTFILLTMFSQSQPVKVMKSDVYYMADILGGKVPGCALMVKGIENDLLVAESCDHVREELQWMDHIISKK